MIKSNKNIYFNSPRILGLQYVTKLNFLLYFAFSSYFTVLYFTLLCLFKKLLYNTKISKTKLRAARKANRPILNGLGSHKLGTHQIL